MPASGRVPLLMMVALPAVLVFRKVRNPLTSLVMVALPAVAALPKVRKLKLVKNCEFEELLTMPVPLMMKFTPP
jgi:hypothetical protein